MCSTPIEPTDDTRRIGQIDGLGKPSMIDVHRECMLRVVIGGIGHLEDHAFWCKVVGDPDGGRTYRQSAIEVDRWVHEHPDGWRGLPHDC